MVAEPATSAADVRVHDANGLIFHGVLVEEEAENAEQEEGEEEARSRLVNLPHDNLLFHCHDDMESKVSANENHIRAHGQRFSEVATILNHHIARLESALEDIDPYDAYSQKMFDKIENFTSTRIT